jgi:hypothetical protein
MPSTKRFREPLPGLPTPEYLNERVAAGWRLVALEWERDVSDSAPQAREWIEEVPYGLKVSNDCFRLEENPDETEIIVLALDMIVEDCPLSRVAEELNRRGYRTRARDRWTPGILFDLLPRMIEVSPRLFATQQWTTRRLKLAKISGR